MRIASTERPIALAASSTAARALACTAAPSPLVNWSKSSKVAVSLEVIRPGIWAASLPRNDALAIIVSGSSPRAPRRLAPTASGALDKIPAFLATCPAGLNARPQSEV